ncbi:MAG: hypothetical protein KME13_23380 [Myxacorys californica WJT36-NPBG1]|jgi:hypothetical protein|nr:hypothetical protein [Myxacorys californica WJT36-NPBG1]
MPEMYIQITNFYKHNWKTLPIVDLALLCSSISMSVATGAKVELRHFDGFVDRRNSVTPSDRIDAAETLQAVAAVLTERLKSLPQDEIEKLDRQQRLIRGVMSDDKSHP